MSKKLTEEESRFVIFGAGVMGKNLAAILALWKKKYPLYFVVSKKEENPDSIMLFEDEESWPSELKREIKVVGIDEVTEKDLPIFVALHEKNMRGAAEDLKKRGFTKLSYWGFDSNMWEGFRVSTMRRGYNKYGVTLDLGYQHGVIDIENDSLPEKEDGDYETIPMGKAFSATVYTAVSIHDKELKEEAFTNRFEKNIQVGTALTDKRIGEAFDNTGDNISEKNETYCELTALYWIWKNDDSPVKGLEHYRRRFDLKEDVICDFFFSDCDFILTVPVFSYETVYDQFVKDHSAYDFKLLEDAIDALCPDYNEALQKLKKSHFYYGYNMIIGKKKPFDDYCEWLFKILEYIEEHTDREVLSKRDNYRKRYIGFLAERLLTLYMLRLYEKKASERPGKAVKPFAVTVRKDFLETLDRENS